MGLLDTVSGAFTALDDYVGDLFKGFDIDLGLGLSGGQTSFISDVLGGAVTGGAIAAISGGDIGKAALYGGLGGAINDNNFGQFGNEIGGALQGYGVGGLGGALGGGLAAYAKDSGAFSGDSTTGGPVEGPVSERVTENDSVFNGSSQTPEGGGGLLAKKLQSYGLMKADGDGTLLGKALIAGVGGMANQSAQESLLEKRQKMEQENYQRKANIDDEQEQRRIGAFTNKQPTFRVQRNG